MSRAATVIVLVCVSLVADARAPRTSAAEHIAAANRAFVAKDYEAALAELRIAYQLAPRPEFLLTFAQIYRAAGQLQQALEACNSYLVTVPHGPLTPGAQKLAATLRAELAATQPPPPPPQPSPPPVATITPPQAPVSATPMVTPSPSPSDNARARRRRLTLGLTLGIGAAVVVGVAVGLGVGLTANQPRPSTYGPIAFTPMP